MAEVLKGLPVAKEINEKTQANIKVLKDAGITPKLAILRVGEKGDDIYYENAAVKKQAPPPPEAHRSPPRPASS